MDFASWKSTMTEANVFEKLTWAQQNGHAQGVNYCWSLIDCHASTIFRTSGFLNINRDLLCQVMDRGTLKILEIELYKQVIEWAKKKCSEANKPWNKTNAREVLDQALFLIRFPTMRPCQFTEIVVNSGILNDNETIAVYKILNFPFASSVMGCPFVHYIRKNDGACPCTACRSQTLVVVRDMFGKESNFLIGSGDTVGSLMAQIEAKEGAPTCRTRLMNAGKALDIDRKLSDYKIVNGSVIHVVQVVRGC